MAPRFAAGSDTRSSCAVPHEQVSPASLSPFLARGFGTPRLLSAILPKPPVGSADPRCMGGSRGSGGSRNRLPAAGGESPLAAPAGSWPPPPLLLMWSRPLGILSCTGQIVAGHGVAQSPISGRWRQSGLVPSLPPASPVLLLGPRAVLTRCGGGGSSVISPLAIWGGGGHSSAGGTGDLGDPLLLWTVIPSAGNADLPSGR